ncbi:MAG: SDR family oxidoreductase [Treponema sp.]|jgi:3-oxoacyl-[acyl-carrier protein] reductase|nr:SDR family oxidoreductase [Treponema sp.]
MEINLKGKIALVTGATGQLGRVMVRTLASCGADVVVHYHNNKSMADSLVGEITAIGSRAVAVQADITDAASVNQMRDTIKSALGEPDIIVNNAMIQFVWTSVIEQDIADFQRQFDACVMQSVLTAKAFLPAMYAKGSGRFIGINTECSAQCNANASAYSLAKRGMDGLYRALAKEAGPNGVNVNQVAPGWTISDKDREEHTEVVPAYSANVPLRRRGTDQEIANVVLFLASELSSFITGVCIPVSGGNVMV